MIFLKRKITESYTIVRLEYQEGEGNFYNGLCGEAQASDTQKELRYVEGYENLFFTYLKGHLIKFFCTNTPHGFIIDIINHYIKKKGRFSPFLQIYS